MLNRIFVLVVLVVVSVVGLFFYRIRQSEVSSNNSESNLQVAEKVEEKNAQGAKSQGDKDVSGENSSMPDDSVKKEAFADLEGGKPIYYYGSTCPHCKTVLDYLDKNDIYTKMEFIKKEVGSSRENSKELTEAALKCGLNPAEIGVPFVFDSGKCYMGGPDVQDFFALKSGLKK
ncbi:MAG: hypothetical protein V3574_01905 [Candidatus Moraniibacteriota bacterium]